MSSSDNIYSYSKRGCILNLSIKVYCDASTRNCFGNYNFLPNIIYLAQLKKFHLHFRIKKLT